MLHLLKNRRAQNTMEYALLIAIVIGVFSAMQLYVRRGMQARIRNGVDNVPDMVLNQEEDAEKVQGLLGAAEQYEPYYVAQGDYSMQTTSKEGVSKDATTESGGVSELTGSTVSRTGTQSVPGAEAE